MRVVALTGAGISRESGIATFRDSDGLWAGYSIDEVCTPIALRRDPQKVLDFYNLRRREVASVHPNPAHIALAELERNHEVTIVTQNIDDLHERGGSTDVVHIHGEIFKVRSMDDFDVVIEAKSDVNLGDLAPDGGQLRPHVCFFNETPYDWELAVAAVRSADVLAIIGTSLQVYPAAGLVMETMAERIVLIDPNPPALDFRLHRVEVIAEPASTGVPKFARSL